MFGTHLSTCRSCCLFRSFNSSWSYFCSLCCLGSCWMGSFRTLYAVGCIKRNPAKIPKEFLQGVSLSNFIFRLILVFIIWGGISIGSFFLARNKSVAMGQLNESNVLFIFINNFFVYCFLFFGFELYGIPTFVISVLNSIFLGYKIIPYLCRYFLYYPQILIFVLLEVSAYMLASFIGFSNNSIKKEKLIKLFLTGCFILFIAALFEHKDLVNLNRIIYENI